jgi:hypothetical protein
LFLNLGVDIPISILGAEIDKLSPPELVEQFEEILSAKPVVRLIFRPWLSSIV